MANFISNLKANGKYIANGIFLTISCLLVISLLTQLTDALYIQIIYIFLAVALDLVRMYVVGLAKAIWPTNWIKSIGLWLVYLAHASIIIIASIGFSLAAINAKTESIKTYNLERSTIIDDVEINKREIKRLEASREKLSEVEWKFKEITGRIDALQRTDRELLSKLENYKEVKTDVDQNVFDVLGSIVKVSGTAVKLYILFILSFLLELSLILTSWDVKVNQNVSDNETKNETPKISKNPEINGVKTPRLKLETQTNNPETETKIPETQTEMVKNGKKICPICGKNFPFKHDDKVFCGAKCRLTAHRHKEAV